uniref:Transposable element Tc3 transposase n=1 Tax=Rhabditophanes sp. KR3021 TaxID=114890 RepID=A0AC35U137_9BILA
MRILVTPELTHTVDMLLMEDEKLSVSSLARETNVSKGSICKVLKKLNHKSYNIKNVQQLLPHDYEARLTFAKNQLVLHQKDPHYLGKILFSDEAHFHLSYGRNQQNDRISESTVWAGLTKKGLIGPYFFEGNVKGVNYLEMLKKYLVPELESRGILNSTTSQQDGAPPHFANIVKNFLNSQFPGKWIGRGSQTPWPSRSPDLTPLISSYGVTSKALSIKNREPHP